jgi:hypothetical protein
VLEIDDNKEDVMDRLLKLRDNIPMHKDENSVIYALLSQINPERYGGEVFAQNHDPHFIMNDIQLQFYVQQFRDIDFQNRHRAGLGPIATHFKKVIICFMTGKIYNNNNYKHILKRRVMINFPDSNYLLHITESMHHRSIKHYHTYVNDETIEKNDDFYLPSLRACINYYNKCVNQDFRITEDSTMEMIL